MNEDTDNWNQGSGQSGGQPPQQQPPQQQPPQQQPPQQQPPQQQPPQQHGPQGPPAKSKTPMLIGIIAVVAVVGILLVWMIMGGSGSGLVGRWDANYMEYEYNGQSNREDMNGWIEFKSDGTGSSYMENESDSFEWEEIGNNQIRMNMEGDEVDFTYSISGNTLTLELEETEYNMTYTMKIVLQRA